MIVEYKEKTFENVEKISFDISNELGVCIHMIKDVVFKDTKMVKYNVTTLEGVELNKLKINN